MMAFSELLSNSNLCPCTNINKLIQECEVCTAMEAEQSARMTISGTFVPSGAQDKSG